MATLKPSKSEEEIKKLSVGNVRIEYNKLAHDYNRIIDNKLLLCPYCNNWQSAEDGFYMDRNYATNRYPICKRCLLKTVEQRSSDKDSPNETKESVQKVLQMMDRVYDDTFYTECVKGAMDEVNEKLRHSPFATYITAIQSLPQWKGKTWKDSDFGDSIPIDEEQQRLVQKTIKSGKKRFGIGYSDSDYMFLEDNYQDFCARTQVDSISQETYVKQICLQLLDIDKDRKSNKDVTNKLKALDTLMNSANLQPRQNVSNAATDSLTFGQLIERWENEKPIPEPAEEFKDVDGIGKYIRIWFAGHLSKALGLKNAYSAEYDEYIKQYTVSKPELTEEGNSEEIYNYLFGKDGD